MDGGDGYASDEERQRGSSSTPSPAESAVPISTGSTWNTPRCMSSSSRTGERGSPAAGQRRPTTQGDEEPRPGNGHE